MNQEDHEHRKRARDVGDPVGLLIFIVLLIVSGGAILMGIRWIATLLGIL